MVLYKTKNENGNLIDLYMATDDQSTHFANDRHFDVYLSKRKNTPHLCIIADTIEEMKDRADGYGDKVTFIH